MTTPVTPQTTGAQAMAQVIAAAPEPFLVGLPGGHTMAIFDAIRDLPGVTAVLAREESIATVIAENHGRSTGRAPVVMAQGAWLLGVGGAGIMEAHLGASPLVVVADTTESDTFSHLGAYQAGFGGYGAFDLATALGAMTKRTFVATSPIQAVEMLQLAFLHATSGEPGPVAVVLHSRAILGSLGEHAGRVDLARPLSPVHPTPSAAAVAEAAALIGSAERPVVVLGNGARGGAEAVRAFVEACDIPYVSTSGGKGVLPEDAPLSAGVIGNFGHDLANRTLGEADAVVVFGSKLS
ncbi:MAG: thiamine pyrophosphate-binding protein, partial [Propionibacteriaceae bacterium]|nr:thiamine pyrophosphate-binding protein [Propionibacteriaceae bacterium]